MENKKGFNYTYSAKEQDEIKKIRKKYTLMTEPEDKMTALRRLDASVYSKATAISLIVGIIGALVMGFGMSLILNDIAASLGQALVMIIGVIFGIIGMVMVSLAYPLYNKTLKKEREKIAPEILRLTDELLK